MWISLKEKTLQAYKNILQEYQSLKFPLLFLIFSLVFETKFTEIVNAILIKTLLSSITIPTKILDILFIGGITIIAILLIHYLIKGYKLSKTLSYWIISLSVIYIRYRFYNIAIFTYVKSKNKLIYRWAYADIILVFTSAILIYYLVSIIIYLLRKPIKKNSLNGFYTDPPKILKTKEDDYFNRLEYIIELKDKILATESNESSFAIGVIGKWGSGKTTFINTLEDLLNNEKKIIQSKFNPWMAGSPNKIIEVFFSDLSTTLGKYDGSLKNTLIKYSKELINSVDEKNITSIIKLFDKGSENLSLVEQNKAISDSISSLNKRLVIYIDDVDRLDEKETMEVLRLIRNTANFKNTFFVVAFDRNYLIRSVNGASIGNIESYIEKIFQLEYYLPININEKACEKIFYDELSKYVTNEQLSVIEWLTNPLEEGGWGSIETIPEIKNFILNFRDVKRLLNIILLNFERIKHNIYLPDYINICILRLKYPDVYFELYFNTNKYLSSTEDTRTYAKETNELKLIYNENDKGKKDIKNTILFLALSSDLSNFSLNQNTLNQSLSLIESIFISNTNNNFLSYQRTLYNHHLSIISPSCFNRYFDFSLEGRLNQNDYESAFLEKNDSFKIFITNTLLEKKSTDLQLSLENTKPKNKYDFEKLIWGILHFADSPSPYNTSHKNGFNSDTFIKIIGDVYLNRNLKIKSFYNNNDQEYKDFFWQLFEKSTNKDSSHYMFQFAIYLLKNYDDKILFTFESIKNWCKSVYENVLSYNSHLNHAVWAARNETIKIYNENENEKKMINNLFRDFILRKDFVGFLNDLISPCPGYHDNSKSLSNFYIVLFGNEETFLNIVETQPENKEACKEFLNFVEEWKAIKNSNSECVRDFPFKYLKN